VRRQRPVEIANRSSGRAHHDARRAETALRATGRDKRAGESITLARVQPFDGRYRSPRDSGDRRDARDARLAVDEHGATSALALGRAAVFGGEDAESLPQRVQERFVGGRGHDDRATVTGERSFDLELLHEASASQENAQEKD
jgi:hypothetical protein